MKNPQLRTVFRSRQSGFSMVEMIGVLAIIAILAVIIVPRVFSTIASARITSAANSITALKAPVTDFAGRYGPIPVTNNNSRIDDLLFTDGLLEGRFVVKIGAAATNPQGATWQRVNGVWQPNGGTAQNTQSRIICVASNANLPSAAGGANYQLSGGINIPAGSRVVSAVLVGVTANEARELSLRIDGDAGSLTLAQVSNTADSVGKVVYGVGATPNVYVYIAHQ